MKLDVYTLRSLKQGDVRGLDTEALQRLKRRLKWLVANDIDAFKPVHRRMLTAVEQALRTV